MSIRDILSWVQFINTCSKTVDLDQMDTGFTYNQLEPAVAYIHGACLVFLDGLGAGEFRLQKIKNLLALKIYDILACFLLVLSADNLCKQTGPRLGPTKHLA